ncbi:MAG: hypothetical protein LQ340_004160, partial [Diploschistes diacapsis]
RASYDRDLARADPSAFGSSGHGPRGGGGAPAGSHSSAQAQAPYGARPASGLNKKRGTFRGPPPSFYRSGGWGSQGPKRRAAAEGAGASAGGGAASSSAGTTARGTGGGFSPGQGERHADANDVPHFDRDGHYRRQETVEERARVRKRILADRAARMHEGADTGLLGRLFVVSAALALAGAVTLSFRGGAGEGTKEERK